MGRELVQVQVVALIAARLSGSSDQDQVQVQVVALIAARLSGSAPLLSSWVAALAALTANHRQSHSMRRHGLFLPRA